jgi:bacteriorhodopsin
MKSNNSLIVMAILFLLFATVMSVVIWADVSSAVKFGFFAFGFGAGIPTGVLISRRQR